MIQDPTATHVADASALGIALGALVGWLPAATALLSFVYILIRLWETQTVQAMFGRTPPVTVIADPEKVKVTVKKDPQQ